MTSDWIAKGVVHAAVGERAHDGLRQAEIGKGLLSKRVWYSLAALRAAVNDSGGCWLNPNRPDGGTGTAAQTSRAAGWAGLGLRWRRELTTPTG